MENQPRRSRVLRSSLHFLTEWSLIPDKGNGICVNGFLSSPSESFLIPWKSSIIVKRLDSLKVLTESGTMYLLVGSMDRERSKEDGIQQRIINNFEHGFPKNWKSLVRDHVILKHKNETLSPCEVQTSQNSAGEQKIVLKRLSPSKHASFQKSQPFEKEHEKRLKMCKVKLQYLSENVIQSFTKLEDNKFLTPTKNHKLTNTSNKKMNSPRTSTPKKISVKGNKQELLQQKLKFVDGNKVGLNSKKGKQKIRCKSKSNAYSQATGITAGKGTIKRKEQIKKFLNDLNEGYEDDLFECPEIKKSFQRKIDESVLESDSDASYGCELSPQFSSFRMEMSLYTNDQTPSTSSKSTPVFERNEDDINQYLLRRQKWFKKESLSDKKNERLNETLEIKKEIDFEKLLNETVDENSDMSMTDYYSSDSD